MADELERRRATIKLPVTQEDLAARYNMKRESNLNDMVETYVRKMIVDDNFRKYLNELTREDALEGDLFLDDSVAAGMIRDAAIEDSNSMVSEQKLKPLIRSLKVVMRRFNISREQRRDNMLNGDD